MKGKRIIVKASKQFETNIYKFSFLYNLEENQMEFASVYHKTSEQMSYALDENQLVVNIKTGYDVKKIFIHYGDPFDAGILGGNEKWTGKREENLLPGWMY